MGPEGLSGVPVMAIFFALPFEVRFMVNKNRKRCAFLLRHHSSLFRARSLAPLLLLLGLMSSPCFGGQKNNQRTVYRTVEVDGLSIFYREAGPKDAPTILLLHGFPSSSRMFEPLFTRLSGQYHLVAPDYPGFGHSEAPDPRTFASTFDHLAFFIERFTEAVGLPRYSLYLQDYGGPVGVRLAIAHPNRLDSLIIQNAVAHEDGLGPLWATRRAFWADRAANEASLRANLISLKATKQRHLGSDPDVDRYDPDLWTDEFAFLSQPKQVDIQSDLFYDYRTDVASYPAWQVWLRKNKPHTLVLWGKYDPSLQVAENRSFQARCVCRRNTYSRCRAFCAGHRRRRNS